MLHIKYFFPLIAAGFGGLCVAVNSQESNVPSLDLSARIQKSQVEKKSGGSMVSQDLTKISPYNFPEMTRRIGIK